MPEVLLAARAAELSVSFSQNHPWQHLNGAFVFKLFPECDARGCRDVLGKLQAASQSVDVYSVNTQPGCGEALKTGGFPAAETYYVQIYLAMQGTQQEHLVSLLKETY